MLDPKEIAIHEEPTTTMLEIAMSVAGTAMAAVAGIIVAIKRFRRRAAESGSTRDTGQMRAIAEVQTKLNTLETRGGIVTREEAEQAHDALREEIRRFEDLQRETRDLILQGLKSGRTRAEELATRVKDLELARSAWKGEQMSALEQFGAILLGRFKVETDAQTRVLKAETDSAVQRLTVTVESLHSRVTEIASAFRDLRDRVERGIKR